MLLLFPTFLLGALVAWAFNEWELRTWRRAAQLHWTEQARLLHPARAGRRANLWTLPIAAAVTAAFFGWPVSWILMAVVTLLGALLGNYPMDRETNAHVNFSRWSRLVATDLGLSCAVWTLLGVFTWYAPREFNGRFAALVLAYLAIHHAFQTGLGRRLRQALGLTHPASPGLQRIVDEISGRMGVPVRATWESDHPTANAMALPITNELIFTRRLVAVCTPAELAAICAHEIGHLTESRSTRAVRYAASLLFFPVIFYRPLSAHGPFFACTAIVLVVYLTWMNAARVARAMEKRADQVARENIEDPAIYARALEKVYEDGLMPVTHPKDGNRIHPDLYDRMLAAGVTPAYARPAPPAGEGWTAKGARAALAVLVVLTITWDGLPELFDF